MEKREKKRKRRKKRKKKKEKRNKVCFCIEIICILDSRVLVWRLVPPCSRVLVERSL